MTTSAPGGFVQLYAEDVIAPGDKLVYQIHPKTQALHRILFHATLEGDPVDGTVEMANVPGGGPSYAARTTVSVPAKKITAKLENFRVTSDSFRFEDRIHGHEYHAHPT